MGDDGTSSALEAFKALHHPERKAAERLLIPDCLRQAEKRKMRHYGHLMNGREEGRTVEVYKRPRTNSCRK